jgi:hypothetical protein
MDALPLLARIARILEEQGLEAVLIGNAAAALQGAPVTTVDFDFMFRKTPANMRKLKALAVALDAVKSFAKLVTGTISVSLYKGNIAVASRQSEFSQYRTDLSSFTMGESYDQKDAEGFIRILGLPSRSPIMNTARWRWQQAWPSGGGQRQPWRTKNRWWNRRTGPRTSFSPCFPMNYGLR